MRIATATIHKILEAG